MEMQLSVPEWLKLPLETRIKLAEIFQIPKSKGSEIEISGSSSILKSDGHTHDDLMVISVERMQNFLNSKDSDFVSLFNAVVKQVEKENQPKEEPKVDLTELQIQEWAATLQRLKGQAVEKDMLPYLTAVVKRVFEIKPEINAPRLPKKSKKAK